MGVGDLNEPEKGVPSKAADKIKEMDLLIAKTFTSFAGRRVLQWLRDEYIEAITAGYVTDARGQINAIASILDNYQREGKKALVKNIEMRIKRANSATIKPVKPKAVI